MPDLSEQRTARCQYYGATMWLISESRWITCRNERPSSKELPFFKGEPDKPHDEFYCGCRGWD